SAYFSGTRPTRANDMCAILNSAAAVARAHTKSLAPAARELESTGGPTMKLRSRSARRIGVLLFSLCAFGLLTSPSMPAEVKFFVEPVVEKKVTELPSGPLYWRLENFPTLAQAQGAAGPTSLAAE